MKRKIAGKTKRLAAAGLAGCLLCGVSIQASAATLKDVFDEHYYADSYGDLKEAYGYDREALWEHFVTFGLQEGRNMNGLIDVVKYRELYADLNDAFGDNWDAYLDHYLTYGAKEGRNAGVDFDALDYAGRYEDLQQAFGEDVLALWQHYRDYGAAEHREARDSQVVEAEKQAESQNPTESQKPEESQQPGESQEPVVTGPYTEREDNEDGSYWIREFDANGKMTEARFYDTDGSYTIMKYDADELLKEYISYYADGTYVINNYVEGKKVKTTHYNADGSEKFYILTDYDEAGEKLTDKWYRQPGDFLYSLWEYENNTLVKETTYYEDGKYRVTLYLYDADGNKTTQSTYYDADNNVITD